MGDPVPTGSVPFLNFGEKVINIWPHSPFFIIFRVIRRSGTPKRRIYGGYISN